MRRIAFLTLFVASLIPLQAEEASTGFVFTEVSSEAGLEYLQFDLSTAGDCVAGMPIVLCGPTRMTGGAAVGDVNGDGWPDLYVTRIGETDILFLNNRDGTFRDGTAGTGLDLLELQSNGCVFGDIDNDGDLDLFVTTLSEPDDPLNGRFRLFVNDGLMRFRELADERGVALHTPEWFLLGFSAAFGDYDRDGYLDLHVTDWSTSFRPSRNRLLKNRGSEAPGYFDDVTRAAGVLLDDPETPCGPDQFMECGSLGFAPAFADLDSDGWPDLAIASDFGKSRLFWNNADGSFTDGTPTAGVATDENGMGSTFGDYDGDGDLDWFVTAIHDPDHDCSQLEDCTWGSTGNRLYRNEGGRRFFDATDEAGVRDGYWGWGTAFLDADNDGDLDLVMTNGFAFGGEEPLFNRWREDPMRFWLNSGDGSFVEVSEAVGISDRGSGKGLLTFDYDRDGDLDLLVINNSARPRLYRNDGGNARDWLRVRVEGAISNRDGLGARVTLEAAPGSKPQVREIGVATHFLGQSERVAHFGLGDGDTPVWRVTVEWPLSGTTNVFHDLSRNTTLVAREPVGNRQLPGDCTQDGRRNIADVLCLLNFAFRGRPRLLPCDSGEATDLANLTLLDHSGNGKIDLGDGIALLQYLFSHGAPPAAGSACEAIPGCPRLPGCDL